MENIRIRFNKANSNSTDYPHTHTRSLDVTFLRDCFEISHNRAQNIITAMEKNRAHCSTDEIELILNYRQLARYVAKRQVDGLNKYWKYPHVIKFIEDDVEECRTVLEIRPDVRSY